MFKVNGGLYLKPSLRVNQSNIINCGEDIYITWRAEKLEIYQIRPRIKMILDILKQRLNI